MIINLKAIQIVSIFLFFSSVTAFEIDYAIHSEWYMLTCAGFGYHLEFDNYEGTFRLTGGGECTTIIQPVFKGKFKIENQTVLLDFGEIKVYYYLKLPYLEACGGESLTKKERKFFCDESYLLKGEYVLPHGEGKDQMFLKKPTLFPSKIEGSKKGEIAESLLNDLKHHCFIKMESE